MEQEAMKCVLEYRPDNVSYEEAHYSLSDGLRRNCGQCVERQRRLCEEVRDGRCELQNGPKKQVHSNWTPEDRYNKPLSPCCKLRPQLSSTSYISNMYVL